MALKTLAGSAKFRDSKLNRLVSCRVVRCISIECEFVRDCPEMLIIAP